MSQKHPPMPQKRPSYSAGDHAFVPVLTDGCLMALELWQSRLSSHFQALATSRKREWVLFGLEHGLDAEERRGLERDVRKAILKGIAPGAYPLPWIVYAAEFGYRYSGYEYWQTFEDETPGWRANGSRAWMRRAFSRFADQYHGAEPEGSW